MVRNRIKDGSLPLRKLSGTEIQCTGGCLFQNKFKVQYEGHSDTESKFSQIHSLG